MTIHTAPQKEQDDRHKAAHNDVATDPSAPYLPSLHTHDTGLPFSFLVELALKTMFRGGRLRLWALSKQLRLPVSVVEPLLEFLRNEKLCEVAQRGPDQSAAEISFQLSAAGRERAESALQKSQYVGPAPVSLESYVAQVERQSATTVHVTQQALAAVFDAVVLQAGLRDDLGTALNSGRPILLHGPSGSGKTFIAEHLAAALSGHIYVPYAILVDDQVIQIYDPVVHRVVPTNANYESIARWTVTDQRWLLCQRPVVMTGGELTLAALDMQFDETSRFYIAPPQVKANNGLFIIDDLGRQQLSPQDLMNRWIVPLDRRIDHFLLHTGKQFCLPFQLTVIFSSNLRPTDLADEAFLRRLGYKIHVGEVSPDDYRKLVIQACEKSSVQYAEPAFDYLLHKLHVRSGKPLLPCTAFDLVSMAHDRATYQNTPATLTHESLDWAWKTYFAAA
jgi:predicted ATPase with chaperone activity